MELLDDNGVMEGLSVEVVSTAHDEAIAAQQGRNLVSVRHPDRILGPTLLVDEVANDSWEIVIQDLGPVSSDPETDAAKQRVAHKRLARRRTPKNAPAGTVLGLCVVCGRDFGCLVPEECRPSCVRHLPCCETRA